MSPSFDTTSPETVPEQLSSLASKCEIAGAWVVDSRKRLAHMVAGYTSVPFSKASTCSVFDLISVLEGLDLDPTDRYEADRMIDIARESLARSRAVRTRYRRARIEHEHREQTRPRRAS